MATATLNSLSAVRTAPLAAAAAFTLAVLFAGGLLAPWIAPYGLEDMDLAARLTAPFTSATHILGTDELGRDVLTRLLYSLRLSFVLAVCGTLIGAVLGTALGFLAALPPRFPSSFWRSRFLPFSARTSR